MLARTRVRRRQLTWMSQDATPTIKLPRAHPRQAEADALVAEALADCRLQPEASQRWNATRILWALYRLTGTMNWPRGWVRSCMLALGNAGAWVPTAAVLRWYRIRMMDVPEQFASSCPDHLLIEDLLAR